MVYCVNFRMRQTKVGRPVNFPLLLPLLLRLLGYPMSTMSSCLSVTALLACCLCTTLHLMYQVQQWLHQKLFLQESRLSLGSSGSHSRTQRSWGPDPVWWGVSAASPFCWFQMLLGMLAVTGPQFLDNATQWNGLSNSMLQLKPNFSFKIACVLWNIRSDSLIQIILFKTNNAVLDHTSHSLLSREKQLRVELSWNDNSEAKNTGYFSQSGLIPSTLGTAYNSL